MVYRNRIGVLCFQRLPSNLKNYWSRKLLKSTNDKKRNFRCKITFLVCVMPAKAPALNMNQFNGYDGCTHCLLIGCRLGSRLISPCDQAFIKRDQLGFHRHAIKAEKHQKAVAGIKGVSSLSSFFFFPADALIDPMHQLFLGTGKYSANCS